MNYRTVGNLFFWVPPFHCGFLSSIQHRAMQTPPKLPENTKFSPAPTSKYDWIGPPDRLSNLRPVIYHIAENETHLEQKLRHLRQETEDWNHEFWTKQNVTFNKEKEEFIQAKLAAKGLTESDETGRKRTLTTEEMAVFYKYFLDKNYKKHLIYNKAWYKRNFSITLLMARVTLQNTWKMLTGQARNKIKARKMSK